MFFSILQTNDASKLYRGKMDLFTMFTFSLEYVENKERLIAAKTSNAYRHCKSRLRTVWQQFG